MRWRWIQAGFVVFALASVICTPASAQGKTAQEMLSQGFLDYNAKNYAEAAVQLEQFLESYGDSAEARPFLEKVERLICFSYLKLRNYSAAEEPVQRYLETFPEGEAVEELSFWQCVLLMKSGMISDALAKIDAFAEAYPQNENLPDLRLMQVIGQASESRFQEVVDLVEAHAEIWDAGPGLQAQTMALYAEIQLEAYAAALERLMGIDLESPELDQISTVHILALELGSRLLEDTEFRSALTALQRAWSRDRILSRQQARLESLQSEIGKEEGRRQSDIVELMRLRGVTEKIDKEIERLRGMENYDTALQFRIAECFFQLGRYRESYLVLSGMLNDLPESDLLMHGNYRLLVCLTRMERWEEVIESAVQFEERFPEAALLPNVVYLMAEAEMRRKDFQSAAAVFARLVAEFPGFAEVERCHFLKGYCLMMTEAHDDAVEVFDRYISQRGSGSGFIEEVTYWRAMAFHYLKEWDRSREAHLAYLEAYPEGRYRADSDLRKTHALFGQKNYREAYKELEAFLKDYPDTIQADEASNLLGDTYFAMGEVERGIEAYERTSLRNPRLYDYAWFRIGKAYKAVEDFETMEAHYREFLEVRPESPRLTEALAQLAWIKRQAGEKEAAAEFYWDAIREHGQDPEALAVEEMLLTLRKYYRGGVDPDPETGRQRYLALLQELESDARRDARNTLAARAVWMQAQLQKDRQDELWASLPEVTGRRELSARMLADAADALRRQGKREAAGECYRTILSWYPRSLYKDRSYAGLGILARMEGDDSQALDYFSQFERETVQSPLWSQVLRSRADIYLARGDYERAIRELEQILDIDSAKGLPWVQALYEIGSIHLSQNAPKKAIPYFQRIYIMYRRWDEYVAKAYWESGQAFEKLQMGEEARNTYAEFVENTHLSERPEYGKAQERLGQLGGA